MVFSKRTFLDLAIRMIGFGVLIGIVFPFFVLLMGVPREIALSAVFITACVVAGLIVGLVNILISKITVRKKLRLLTAKMDEVKNSILQIAENGNTSACDPEHCSIPVESNDEFGQSAKAFNELIGAFARSLRTLDEIKTYTDIFSSQLDLQALTDNVLDLVIRSSAASAGALFIDREGEIELLASVGIREAGSLVTNPMILTAFSKGLPSVVGHPDEVIVESTLTQFHPKEVLIEPVKFKNIPIGVILLAKAEPFEADYKKHISIFSLSLAVALHNALEHEQLQKLAALDPLTGIYNRRFGLVRLHEEFSRAVRKDLPLAVLMFDIDHFKKVNDTYGHVAGDRVLKNITRLIRQGMREGDILIRYGGEEFLLLLPGASKTDALRIAERIRHIVRENKVSYASSQIGITVSIGCDSYPESPVTSDQDLIANADEALYLAKNSGRDKVVMSARVSEPAAI